MAKEREERIQSAHDVKLQLEWIAEAGSQAGVPAPVVAKRRTTQRLAWIVAAVALALAGLTGTGPAGTISRCHPHDPSWQNWPALEHAIIDNIVPDFPLINKSFNLSYSGHDL